MAASEENYSIQLVDGDGKFNSDGINEFLKRVKLSSCGLSYAVVSIMGPQSSGKSTLLNHLFGTNFRMMNALEGRSQTTKGIWLAKCSGIEPCTLVMDMEGTDGRERGEDDKVFEKQSALFALAISDIVLINMWCQDIGREQAASKPLLKTVFQVMVQLFNPRKTTLLFVLRDQTKTRAEILATILLKDIQKIWDSISKPEKQKKTPLSDFFNVEIVALPSYERKQQLFKQQVAFLRQRFINSIAPGGLAGDRKGVIPASEFGFSTEEIWKTIKENKDLDLPTHNVMVAKVRCEGTANKKLDSFLKNMRWNEIEKDVQSTMVSGFGATVSSIIDPLLLEYDEECKYFDEGVRTKEREQLINKLLQLVRPAYEHMLHHIQSQIMENFKQAFENELDGGKSFSVTARTCLKSSITQFDEQCSGIQIKQGNWDSFKERDTIQADIKAHITAIRIIKLNQLFSEHKEILKKALIEHVEALLEEGSDETWPEIRNCLTSKTESTINNLCGALSDFDVDEQTQKNMLGGLKDFATQEVQTTARRTANTQRVLDSMKTRFSQIFIYDSNLMPRDWRGKSDAEIDAITKDARLASLKLLSVMAAIRLDENDADNIEDSLIRALMAAHESSPSNDLLISNTWEKVESSKTLIAPVQCKSIWWQFIEETKDSILIAKEASKPVSDEGNKLSKGAEITAKVIGTTLGIALDLLLLGGGLGGGRGRSRGRGQSRGRGRGRSRGRGLGGRSRR